MVTHDFLTAVTDDYWQLKKINYNIAAPISNQNMQTNNTSSHFRNKPHICSQIDSQTSHITVSQIDKTWCRFINKSHKSQHNFNNRQIHKET